MKKTKKLLMASSLSFQNRLMLSYSFVLVLILTVGIFLYQISFQQLRTGISAQSATMLSSSVRRLDMAMFNISTVSQQISAISSFTALARSDPASADDFYYRAYMTQQDLRQIFPLTRYLNTSDTFIYMERSGYIISSSDFLSFESYAKYRLFCTPEMAAKLEGSLHDEDNRNHFIPLSEFDSRMDGYLYFYPIASGNVFSEKYIVAYLCCIFDQDLMEEYFPGMLQEGCSIVAHDGNGKVKLQLSKHTFPPSGSTLANQWQSEYNNWSYTFSQPREHAYYSLNHYRDGFIAITLLAFVLEGAVIYYFSIINSKPVIKLSNELVVQEERASSLHDLVEKHRPVVAESYLRRIMEGGVTTADEMVYIAKDLGLDRAGLKYQVLYMEVYPSEDYDVQVDDMALCLQNFDVLVRDALKRHFPDTGYLYKPSDRIFAVLLASPSAMSSEQVMLRNRESFMALHTELLSQFGIWSRGGFGDFNTNISNTWKSYQQAKDAKSIATAESYIKGYHDFVHANDTYYYPEIMSVQLTGAIAIGNKGQVAELFWLIDKENTQRRSLSPQQKQQLCFDIRSTLFKKRHSIPANGAEGAGQLPDPETQGEQQQKRLDRIDYLFDNEMGLNVLKTIALELCELFTPKSSSNELIVKILRYITDNYHDPSLCLSKISDEFNISENYFSFLFKKESNENFSSYLEKLRMAKARELVCNSDIGLSNLYQYLGYSNAASFRRVFKKTFGVSPKEMREQKHG